MGRLQRIVAVLSTITVLRSSSFELKRSHITRNVPKIHDSVSLRSSTSRQVTEQKQFTIPNVKNNTPWSSSIVTIEGPPVESKPDYDQIHGPWGKMLDRLLLIYFRTKMAEQVGFDSKLPKDDYDGLMELTAALNARYSDRRVVQKIAQNVLVSLFPSWLPPRFAIMFAKPFPKFSNRLNAWATMMFGTWLMGECELNDCDTDDDGKNGGISQGVLVKRCRFLDGSSCASVCVNSCKIPTQNFFSENMGLPLTMEPDYETGECQFSFGLTPTTKSELDAMETPCIRACPTLGSMRKWHDGKGGGVASDDKDSKVLDSGKNSNRCGFMD